MVCLLVASALAACAGPVEGTGKAGPSAAGSSDAKPTITAAEFDVITSTGEFGGVSYAPADRHDKLGALASYNADAGASADCKLKIGSLKKSSRYVAIDGLKASFTEFLLFDSQVTAIKVMEVVALCDKQMEYYKELRRTNSNGAEVFAMSPSSFTVVYRGMVVMAFFETEGYSSLDQQAWVTRVKASIDSLGR